MRRLLRLPVDGPEGHAAEARKAFQTSLMVATVRCLLMYIVFPFVLPAIGIAAGSVRGSGCRSPRRDRGATMSIRRFWRADHSKRWHYTIFGGVVICFLISSSGPARDPRLTTLELRRHSSNARKLVPSLRAAATLAGRTPPLSRTPGSSGTRSPG
jgi:hypothetical protein